jgi:hypothetical protein
VNEFSRASKGCVAYAFCSPSSTIVVVEQKESLVIAGKWAQALLSATSLALEKSANITIVLFRETGGTSGCADGQVRRNRLLQFVLGRENCGGLSTVFMFSSAAGLAVTENSFSVTEGADEPPGVAMKERRHLPKEKKARKMTSEDDEEDDE